MALRCVDSCVLVCALLSVCVTVLVWVFISHMPVARLLLGEVHVSR